MSAYEDAFIAEAEALSNKLIAEGDARLASATARLSHCHKRVKKTEGIHRNDQEHFRKAELALEKHKVSIVAPHILAAYERLPSVELKLKIAEFEHQRKTDEYQRLQAKHLDASKSEIRLKKANKQLTNTVETLTAQLEGKSSPQEQTLQNENDELKKKLALLQAQLDSKTKECDAKDQAVEDLREDFGAYQSVYEDTWSHRHDGCNELAAALEEQCEVLQSNFEALQGINNTLEGNLNTLHHKLNSAAKERDNLQERYKESIKAHKMELEDLDTFECEGSSGCTSCVVHLERALRISRAAEVQALQLVDQVNHDRMVAWNQLHEHQTRLSQENYASVGAWVAARQAPSLSPTLVSPDFKPSEGDENGWKITGDCDLSESSSVEFHL